MIPPRPRDQQMLRQADPAREALRPTLPLRTFPLLVSAGLALLVGLAAAFAPALVTTVDASVVAVHPVPFKCHRRYTHPSPFGFGGLGGFGGGRNPPRDWCARFEIDLAYPDLGTERRVRLELPDVRYEGKSPPLPAYPLHPGGTAPVGFLPGLPSTATWTSVLHQRQRESVVAFGLAFLCLLLAGAVVYVERR